MADLREQFEAELEQIDQSLAMLPPAEDILHLDALELAGVGAALHSFYNGIEKILKQALMSRNVPMPTGDSFHRELIQETVKVGVISSETATAIGGYMAFRHFFRHAYTTHLDPEQLVPLVQGVDVVYGRVKEELAGFLSC